MLPSDLIAPKNDANQAIYWRKISLLKKLLTETISLFPCMNDIHYNGTSIIVTTQSSPVQFNKV